MKGWVNRTERRDLRSVQMAIGRFDDSAKERLSALADGEVDGADPAALCAGWAGDEAVRRDWHAWHLIGDVLRSEDLASDPRRDRQLCAAIRARLRQEPVVLAPAPVAAGHRGRWAVGGAIAAGLVLAVGTFTVLHPVGDSLLAQGDRPAVVPVVVATAPAAEQPPVEEPVVADMRMIRDAQLDRYLAAHKQFAGTSALGVPSAFLRSATLDTASR
jgi:sigma-E factor negative regulatory protein RseA